LSIKVTTESFIEKAIEVHGDAYDYSMSVYTKGKDKLKIRCVKHDLIFEITPNSHVSAKGGCPVCRYEKSSEKNRKPKDSFVSEAVKLHGDRFDYSSVDYITSKTKVKIRCVKHNLVFEQAPDDHMRSKSSCPVCLKEKIGASRRDTTETFVKKSKEKFGDIFDYNQVDYVTAKVKVKIRCIEHDTVFETTPDSHLSKVSKGNCPVCKKEAMGQYHRMSVDEFSKRATILHEGRYDYSHITSMKNMHCLVPIQCRVHGIFLQSPTNHLHSGFGCSECAAIERGLAGRLTQEEVISRFHQKHGEKYDYSEVCYTTIYDPVKIYCKEHKHFFDQAPSNHFSGTGCRYCIDKGYSKVKAGYFYINKVSDNVALKVGITNICPIKRAKVLDSRSEKHEITNLFYFYHEDGNFIWKLEEEILNRFETGIISKSEMSSGFTETISCVHLPEIIDIVTLRFNQYPEVYLKPD
jgi:hypothetical protein